MNNKELRFNDAFIINHESELNEYRKLIIDAFSEARAAFRLDQYSIYLSRVDEKNRADIRNFNGKPIEGAINAAKFLESFTENHPKWMHLDIAGVSFGSSPYAKMKSATGFGIQLITNFIKEKATK